MRRKIARTATAIVGALFILDAAIGRWAKAMRPPESYYVIEFFSAPPKTKIATVKGKVTPLPNGFVRVTGDLPGPAAVGSVGLWWGANPTAFYTFSHPLQIRAGQTMHISFDTPAHDDSAHSTLTIRPGDEK